MTRHFEDLDNLPAVLNASEVGKILRIELHTVLRLLRSGKLQGTHYGVHSPWRVTKQALLKYLEGK